LAPHLLLANTLLQLLRRQLLLLMTVALLGLRLRRKRLLLHDHLRLLRLINRQHRMTRSRKMAWSAAPVTSALHRLLPA